MSAEKNYNILYVYGPIFFSLTSRWNLYYKDVDIEIPNEKLQKNNPHVKMICLKKLYGEHKVLRIRLVAKV